MVQCSQGNIAPDFRGQKEGRKELRASYLGALLPVLAPHGAAKQTSPVSAGLSLGMSSINDVREPGPTEALAREVVRLLVRLATSG